MQVRAAALNYRDVMLAEGMLPPGAEPATGTGPRLGLECAGDALDRHLHRSTCQAAVGVMDGERLSHLLPAVTAPRFSAHLTGGDRSNRARAQAVRQQLKAADSDEDRLGLITRTLTEVAAHVLQTSPDRINPSANLTDLGLDSLMGAELKVLMDQTFACELPLMEMMAAGTVNGLAQRLHLVLSPVSTRAAHSTSSRSTP